MIARPASHLSTLIFGAVAVGAFWAAIQMFRSAGGKPWPGVLARVIGAVVLIALGIVLIFYAAFG